MVISVAIGKIILSDAAKKLTLVWQILCSRHITCVIMFFLISYCSVIRLDWWWILWTPVVVWIKNDNIPVYCAICLFHCSCESTGEVACRRSCIRQSRWFAGYMATRGLSVTWWRLRDSIWAGVLSAGQGETVHWYVKNTHRLRVFSVSACMSNSLNYYVIR